MTQEQIAARLGWARTRVANRMRLLLLQEDIQQSLASGQINEGHARALMQIEDAGMRLDAWRRIVSDALTVRQAEEIARALKAVSGSAPAEPGRAPSASAGSEQSAHLRLIERDLREALGARVAVTGGKRGGRILITYHSEEELDGILQRIIG
ncbi:MAG TPA: chromosome partitioning protein ParB, partial [Dehalococcoidia bacterium]|nr:chromosome partitioning protein ParB [Dehalococcoidia bacterium]